MSTQIKILTVIYLAIIVGIIIVADLKGTRYLLRFVGSIPFGDKIGHFMLFGILALLVNLTLKIRSAGFGKIRYLLGSLVIAVAITIEEFTQIFMRGRTFDLMDLLCGLAGILVFGELARLIYRKFPADPLL